MFEYVKISKNMILYIILIGFLISLPAWYDIYLGVTNTIFSIIFSFISFLIILFVFNSVGNYYGLYLNIEDIFTTKKMTYFSLFKRTIVKNEQKIGISFIITGFIGILTLGRFVPMIFGLKPIVIESKRIGKSKNLEVSIGELNKIIFLSIIFLWIIASTLKYFSPYSAILDGFLMYFSRFLIFFTYSSIIPWNYLLAGILGLKLGYNFNNRSIGDNLFTSLTRFYFASSITVSIVPILFLILDPISSLIISIAIFSAIWIRFYSKSILP